MEAARHDHVGRLKLLIAEATAAVAAVSSRTIIELDRARFIVPSYRYRHSTIGEF